MEVEFSNPVERLAAQALDKLADLVVGPASTLRDGAEHRGVELPRDMYAHREAQTEWWYYTGHVETERGRRLGFEWVFFKRRTDLDRFGVVPLRLIANPLYLAHFAITDVTCGRFRYAHRKSANGPLDLPASASVRRYRLRLGDWTARELHGLHILRGTLDDLTFEVALKPEKPPVLNGHNGVSFKDHGEASRYFSFTRMSAEGEIAWRGRIERCVGQAWMDREFGTWRATENQRGWDWFSLQLSDNTELMVYHIRDSAGRPSAFSSGTFVDAEGRATHLQREDFALQVLGRWRSPHTGAIYPSGWQIQVPRLSLDLAVRPLLDDQELDTRGTTMVVYWEGACEVTGRSGERSVDGQAYVELVGYDRSHERPSFTTFLFGSALDRRWRSIFG